MKLFQKLYKTLSVCHDIIWRNVVHEFGVNTKVYE